MTRKLRYSIYVLSVLCIFSVFPFQFVSAQFPYTETFKKSTAPGMVVSGSAYLTSGIDDPTDEGFLRLTGNGFNESGSAYNSSVFNSNQGLVVEFEYFVHGGTPFPNPGGTTGDGFCFFLFDGDAAFSPGAYGGSLGYANKNDPPTVVIDGLGNAYIGVGLDEFGNFSSTFEGKNGGPGFTPSAVAIRGPGNGQDPSYYAYQTGQQTTVAPFNFPLTNNAGGRDPMPSGTGYRKVKIEMSPILTGSTVTGYTITVTVTQGGATPVAHTVINSYAYNFVPPPRLKFGFTASTGLATSYHEIRNLGVNVFDPSALTSPTAVDDAVTACSGSIAAVRVTENDFTPNGGGTSPFPPGENFNRATVDLNIILPGIQNALTQAGIGDWSVDTGGVVQFNPVPGYLGTATLQYFVTDVYGETTTTPGTISMTITADNSDAITATSPQVVCAPSTVDLTDPSVWSATPGGGTVIYSTDPMGTYPITDPTNISTQGKYYVRYTATNSCVSIVPIDVTIGSTTSVPTTVSNYNCGTGTVELSATGAGPGETYIWYNAASGGSEVQNGGSSFTTPSLSNTTQYWVTLFTSGGGSCESSRVPVTATINDIPIGVDAGTDQVLSNVASIQLNGSAITTGLAGLWTLASGPNVPVIVEPTLPSATVEDLTPGTYVFEWTVQDATCTASDQVTVQVLSVLPVTLVDFSAVLKGETAHLQWSTTTELNNREFVIERSNDGNRFTRIGSVPGSGNSSELLHYSFTDPIAGATGERVYYRLQQRDLDGTSSYSKIVSVAVPADKPQISIAPNPFTDQVNIKAVVNSGGMATVSVYNIAGVRIKQFNQALIQGGNTFRLQLQDLPKGIYTLEVVTGNQKGQSWKIIKK